MFLNVINVNALNRPMSSQGLVRIGSTANISRFSWFFSFFALNSVVQIVKFLSQKPQHFKKNPTPKIEEVLLPLVLHDFLGVRFQVITKFTEQI